MGMLCGAASAGEGKTPLYNLTAQPNSGILQIRPPRTPASQAYPDAPGAERRMRSMSSVIKQGRWPLTQHLSSIWTWYHVVPKSHTRGQWVTCDQQLRQKWRDSCICCFWMAEETFSGPKANPIIHHAALFVKPSVGPPLPTVSTMLKNNQPHILLLYLFFVILRRFWLQLWLYRVGGRTHA